MRRGVKGMTWLSSDRLYVARELRRNDRAGRDANGGPNGRAESDSDTSKRSRQPGYERCTRPFRPFRAQDSERGTRCKHSRCEPCAGADAERGFSRPLGREPAQQEGRGHRNDSRHQACVDRADSTHLAPPYDDGHRYEQRGHHRAAGVCASLPRSNRGERNDYDSHTRGGKESSRFERALRARAQQRGRHFRHCGFSRRCASDQARAAAACATRPAPRSQPRYRRATTWRDRCPSARPVIRSGLDEGRFR